MKLPISSLTWLVSTSIIYSVVALFNIFAYKFSETEFIQMVWVLVTSTPLWLPMRRFIDIDPVWKL